MPEPSSERATLAKQRRNKRLLWAGLTIVAAALVVFAVSALTAPKAVSEKPPAITVTGSDYDRGVSAIESGDTTAGLALLRKAAAAGDKRAEARLREILTRPAANTPAPGSSTPSGTTPPATETPAPVDPDLLAKPVSDITLLLPTKLDGFEPGTAQSSGKDVQLPLSPTIETESRQKVSLVMLGVHERATAADAAAFASSLADRLYSKDRRQATVKGGPATFGTDGMRLGAIVFSRGVYTFDVVVTSTGEPATTFETARLAAEAFVLKP